MKRYGMAAMFAIVLAAMLAATVFAAGNVDLSQKATLTVKYFYAGRVPITDAEFTLYRIGTISESGELIVDRRFSGYRIRLDFTDEEDWSTMARTLYGYLQRDRIPSIATGSTNGKGILVIPDLPVGLYLLAGGDASDGDYTYSSEPFFLILPTLNDEGVWEYDVTVKPKCYREHNPPERTVSRKVIKVWKEDEGRSRPRQITVQLLCDGSIFDVQTLNAGNNWRYEWKNLDAQYEWTVVEEIVPTDYTVRITREGTTFIVTNTYQAEQPPPPPDKPELPQTGMLWWPVFLAAGIGVLSVAVGVFLKRKNDNRHG
ncbi:Cna B-type domain-containing protein [Diplocloster agilis]|uniref:Cna B-type domain-containing protein n=1 Tax=Diplocloster agilis TaxID=2850323 RepID=UPI002265A36C|nr:Cna B-type domain-containing protein [Suonthocola fibrivorans]MCU6736294.1 Cna B-type domain-containing protein [Suonthocola fibrivorans]